MAICCLVTRFSRLTLWDPRDCSPPGSSVQQLLQARTLEWVAILFSWNGHLSEVLSCPLFNPHQIWLPMGNRKKILRKKKLYILLFTFLFCVCLWKYREYILTVTQYISKPGSLSLGFPGGSVIKESPRQCRKHKRHRFHPWVKKVPWRRKCLRTLQYSCLGNPMERRAWWLQSTGPQRVRHD